MLWIVDDDLLEGLIQGWSEPSFLLMKKICALTGEAERQNESLLPIFLQVLLEGLQLGFS